MQAAAMEALDRIQHLLRRCLFAVIAWGPLPRHVSFILDGNRRYGRKFNVATSADTYHVGYLSLVRTLRYCSELGLTCVSVYAFSIDNFRRSRKAVDELMEILREKIEGLLNEVGFLHEAGIRIRFLGNLPLLDPSIRDLIHRAEAATASNRGLLLLVCLAYTSTDEIARAAAAACEDGLARARGRVGSGQPDSKVLVADVERRMDFAGLPEVDLLVRTSGEWRLSNFLLWQSAGCLLHAPRCLWPEFSLLHLVSAIIHYQRHYSYLRSLREKIHDYVHCGCMTSFSRSN